MLSTGRVTILPDFGGSGQRFAGSGQVAGRVGSGPSKVTRGHL